MTDHEKDETEMTTTAVATAPAPSAVSSESRNWAVFTHLSAFVAFFGIPSVVGPVVLWAIKRQEDPYVDFHGKEAMNMNISFLIYSAVSAILILALVGLVLLPAVLVTWFVLVIIGAVKAGNGEHYKYPLTIQFIR